MKDYNQFTGYIYTLSGKKYPDFAIGTYSRTEDELVKLLDEYPYDKIMLDTAFRYGNEDAVARAVKRSCYPCEDVIYIGKINTYQQESGRAIQEEFFDTLKRLRLEKIDIYLIHSDRSPNITTTWKAMIELRRLGLIDMIGVSNFGIESIERLHASSGVYPEVIQLVLPENGFDLEFQKILQFCQEKGMLIQIASPFGGFDGKKNITQEERKKLLMNIRSRGYVCVFGTTNIAHLRENVSWISLGR